MTDPDRELRANAIIQSLERQRNEALTSVVQKDAIIALLQEQVKRLSQELADLKKKMDEAEAAAKAAADGKAVPNGASHKAEASAAA